MFPNDHAHLPADYPVKHAPSIEDSLTECDHCNVDCWISPEAKVKIRELKAVKLCPACVHKVMLAQPSAVEFEHLTRPTGTPLRRRR